MSNLKTPTTPQVTLTTQQNKSSNLTPKLLNSGTSFVKKHLQIQRRKTIHDIINFDIINNLISKNSSSSTDNNNAQQANTSQKQQAKLNKNQNSILNDKNLINTIDRTVSNGTGVISSTSTSYSSNSNSSYLKQQQANDTPSNQIARELVIQGHVQLLNVKYFKPI